MRAAIGRMENILVTHRPGLSYQTDYSVSSLILMFFTFSFAGWLWEVGLHLVVDGMFFNRGFMFLSRGLFLLFLCRGLFLLFHRLVSWFSLARGTDLLRAGWPSAPALVI